MGQKVHPKGFRLGVIEGWESRWFAEKEYAPFLHDDIRIRNFIKKRLQHAGIAKLMKCKLVGPLFSIPQVHMIGHALSSHEAT